MPPAPALRNPLILRRVDWGGPMDLVIQWAPPSRGRTTTIIP